MEKNIVLLHGFGEDHRVFDAILPLPDGGYHIYTPDLPGSGILADAEAPAEIEKMADWLAAYANGKGLKSFVLLGHSMGGYIALAFAEKYADRLVGLGLLHSTAYADSPAKKDVRFKAIDFMHQKSGFTFLKTAIPGLFAPNFARNNPNIVDQLVEQATAFSTQNLQQYYRAMANRPDRSEILKNATFPVLIIAGTEDNAAPIADLSAQAALPAICHFSILEDTGHMGMLEKPQAFAAIILTFLKRLSF
ncbi:MAG: alpha/beta hydrolase [Chitinophagaceae bacterium]|jgi:pimeloyl-ACP methyl ester carboxylesterase|nr:alpha/beta hydrolase [Chitinophagaceae bacterium]